MLYKQLQQILNKIKNENLLQGCIDEMQKVIDELNEGIKV